MVKFIVSTTTIGMSMLTHINIVKAMTGTVNFFFITITSMPLVDTELNKSSFRQVIKKCLYPALEINHIFTKTRSMLEFCLWLWRRVFYDHKQFDTYKAGRRVTRIMCKLCLHFIAILGNYYAIVMNIL